MDDRQRDDLVEEMRARFRAAADSGRAEKARAFFPSNPPILGTPGGFSNDMGKEVARRLKAEGNLSDVVAVAEALYRGGIMDEAACANEMVGRFWRRFGPDDWPMFDRWVDWFNNWGTTDSFCLKVLGHLVLRDGPPMARLRDWARSDHVWRRRASLVCMIRAGRKGRYVEEILELADMLLDDPDDVVQKAIGWTLKELCKGSVETVIEYLRPRRERMTSLAFRYACERMSPEQKARARGSEIVARPSQSKRMSF